MKCMLKGVGAFVACGLLVALILPSIRGGGSYTPKNLSVKVKVIDTDEHKGVADAEVTFFRGRDVSLDDAEPHLDDFVENSLSVAVTDANGNAEVMGTFSAWASRTSNLMGGHDRWYRLGGGWLKVVATGRPVAFVPLDGNKFGGERDYENNEPLEVIVVVNKVSMP
jgi:hypothetical protein